MSVLQRDLQCCKCFIEVVSMQSISVIQAAICNSRAAFWDLYQVASACKVIKLPMCEEVMDLSDLDLSACCKWGLHLGHGAPWMCHPLQASPRLSGQVGGTELVACFHDVQPGGPVRASLIMAIFTGSSLQL